MKKARKQQTIAVGCLLIIAMGLLGNSTAAAIGAADSEMTSERCYIGTRTVKPRSAAGITTGTMMIRNKWCAQSGEVTESKFVDYLSETSTPFNRFIYLPDATSGAEIADNRALAWKQFVLMFELDTGLFSITKPTDICVRSIGTAYGTMSGDSICGAY